MEKSRDKGKKTALGTEVYFCDLGRDGKGKIRQNKEWLQTMEVNNAERKTEGGEFGVACKRSQRERLRHPGKIL